jgi:hypothetical protein
MLRTSPKRQIGFRQDLPFAPPVLRGWELYTLTFHPGARLARQTVGGGVRAIAGTRHPSWVNRTSASRLVSDGRTRVGADRALLFVSTGLWVANPGPASLDQSSQASLLTPSSSLTGMLMPPHLVSHQYPPHLRNPSRCSCRDSQSGQ